MTTSTPSLRDHAGTFGLRVEEFDLAAQQLGRKCRKIPVKTRAWWLSVARNKILHALDTVCSEALAEHCSTDALWIPPKQSKPVLDGIYHVWHVAYHRGQVPMVKTRSMQEAAV